MSESDLNRAGEKCYWCGGDVADGGSIRIQVNEGEPERETCPDCFRDWPPEGVAGTQDNSESAHHDD